MNYVRSITGSVSKGWNSINPATLSGAIDAIVVEREDGSLACSPFHVRFGKYQILRPSDKKVEFRVNGELQPYAMKLGEGGEAFFVFETSAAVPAAMQTSPIASPVASPEQKAVEMPGERAFEDELEPLELDGSPSSATAPRRGRMSMSTPTHTPFGADDDYRHSDFGRPDWSGLHMHRANTDEVLPLQRSDFTTTPALDEPGDADRDRRDQLDHRENGPLQVDKQDAIAWHRATRSASPPPVSASEAFARAIKLSKKLFTSNIPNKVTESGDLELDMTGYKSSDEDALRAEVIARKILSDELAGDYDIGALIGADENGNLWIYSSEEAKAAAMQKTSIGLLTDAALHSSDAVSDPGYQSDSNRSDDTADYSHMRTDSDSALGMSAPQSPEARKDRSRTYAKTLRLTSDQLKALHLKPGANTMSFTVNRSTCNAYMFYWKHDVPIVISDIDGTITKSDALGHVLNMIGRDWTHQGVAKLYTDIVNNGYNIFYLTSRSVGQADTTRAYLNGVVQDNYRLPTGPVIMSPDRTIAALRREIYLRKPEVFKMACLRDIMQLFDKPVHQSPFYAGFGNRFTDALSYRSVNIPSIRIFTINSNAEVSLDVLSLNSYKTGYASMREIVDHFFPPVGLLVPAGGEAYTDFNYWRDPPLDIADFTGSESGTDDEDNDNDEHTEAASLRSEDEGSELGEDLEASYLTQDSQDDTQMQDSVVESVEGDFSAVVTPDEGRVYMLQEDSGDEGDQEDELEEDGTPAKERDGWDGPAERVPILVGREETLTPRASPRK